MDNIFQRHARCVSNSFLCSRQNKKRAIIKGMQIEAPLFHPWDFFKFSPAGFKGNRVILIFPFDLSHLLLLPYIFNETKKVIILVT